ncbi:MAG: YchJ family protein [Deltaproteobacteria bacterium]|nr:YchJ family protein [Deltaproteobacteria bacterium]
MACPCGSGRPESQCCGPWLAGAPAPTAQALMRSRYTAYVRQQIDYLLETHDPDTRAQVDREATARWAREAQWTGLTVLDVVAGAEGDEEGEVDFEASWSAAGQNHTHRERSRFRKVEGRWFFVGGSVPKRNPTRVEPKPKPNEPCSCGSGKKYKRCHGQNAGG